MGRGDLGLGKYNKGSREEGGEIGFFLFVC